MECSETSLFSLSPAATQVSLPEVVSFRFLGVLSSSLCTHVLMVIVKELVAQLCLTVCNPLDCSLPDSSVHGILQARILEWVAISSSRLERDPQLSLATRGEDWASQGQPQGKAEIPVVTLECRRNSRKTTWFPSPVPP